VDGYTLQCSTNNQLITLFLFLLDETHHALLLLYYFIPAGCCMRDKQQSESDLEKRADTLAWVLRELLRGFCERVCMCLSSWSGDEISCMSNVGEAKQTRNQSRSTCPRKNTIIRFKNCPKKNAILKYTTQCGTH